MRNACNYFWLVALSCRCHFQLSPPHTGNALTAFELFLECINERSVSPRPTSTCPAPPLSSRRPPGVQCPLCVLNGIKPNRNWKGVAVSACCRRLLCERVPVLYFRFRFRFSFYFFFLLVFGFFHSAFAFVIKWNLARRLAALNASQCAAIFISFNAHTNRLRETAQGRRDLPDNGKVHTNKCNKMIGMSRLSMRHGVSLCCPSSQLPSLFPTQDRPKRNLRKSSPAAAAVGAGVGQALVIKRL